MEVDCDVSWTVNPNDILVEFDQSRQVLTVRVPPVEVEAVDTNTENLAFSVSFPGAASAWLDGDHVAELKDAQTRRIRSEAKARAGSSRNGPSFGDCQD